MPGDIINGNRAFILANTYGLCPEPDLKYEPNWKVGHTYYFTLASRRRSINVLVKFDDWELEPPPA